MKTTIWLAVALGSLSACVIETDNDDDEAAATASEPAQLPDSQRMLPAPARLPSQTSELRIEVDLSDRRLNVYQGERQLGSYPAAVGSEQWPTPTGEWTISQVIFNPRWVPPKGEEWAEDEEIAEPGAPDNPLGVVQLVYNPPNTIHGTDEPESLGKPVSHGSIRVSNNVGIGLAKLVMKAGGAEKDEAFVADALRNRTQRVEVTIPQPVPIRVVE